MIESQLLRELNPKYDLVRHKDTLDSWSDCIVEPVKMGLNSVKSVVRGASIGTAIGISLGYLFDDVQNGVIGGVILGAGIDFVQYESRMVYHSLKGFNRYLDSQLA